MVNNDGGKGGGGITSPPHPRQIFSAHFPSSLSRDLFNGFLTSPPERLRYAPSRLLMLLLLFKRSDCMHKVLTCIYVVNTSWANCKKLHVALLTSWPHDLYCPIAWNSALREGRRELLYLRAHSSAEYEAMATNTKEKTDTSTAVVAPIMHRHDKALADAKSAIGRIEARLEISLKKARLVKDIWTGISSGDASRLNEAERKTLKLHSRVLTAYSALEEAIAALDKK